MELAIIRIGSNMLTNGRMTRRVLVEKRNGRGPYQRWLAMVLLIFVTRAFGDPVPCVDPDLSAANRALADSKGTLESVQHFLSSGDAKTLQLVTRWFGRGDQGTINSVTSVLSRTSSWVSNVSPYCLYQNDGSLVQQVTAPDGSIALRDVSSDVYGYVVPADLGKITLGLMFFSAPATGMNSQLGTIVHEVTHYFLTGNTDDIRYGKDDCLQLAQQDPKSAINNADSYEYFIEEWLGSSLRSRPSKHKK